MLRARCLKNSNKPRIWRCSASLLEPLGSNSIQNWRLKSQIPMLFRFFYHLAGVVATCCALDASKTQTALVSAMFRLFFGASWQCAARPAPPAQLSPAQLAQPSHHQHRTIQALPSTAKPSQEFRGQGRGRRHWPLGLGIKISKQSFLGSGTQRQAHNTIQYKVEVVFDC